MPEEPIEVSVSVPQDLELTAEEKDELKQRFKADVVEVLGNTEAANAVEFQIVDMQY